MLLKKKKSMAAAAEMALRNTNNFSSKLSIVPAAEMALKNTNNFSSNLSIVQNRKNSRVLDTDNLISNANLRKKTDVTEEKHSGSKFFRGDSVEAFKNNSIIRPMSLNYFVEKNQKIRKEINNVMQDIIKIARAAHKPQIIQDIQRNYYAFKLHSAKPNVTRNNPYSYTAGQESLPIINTSSKILLTQK